MDNNFSLSALIRSRRSTRRFQEKSVSRALLLQCVEAARLAPSAENSQPWRFFIVDDPACKDTLAQKAFGGVFLPTRWAAAAPVLVVLCLQTDSIAKRMVSKVAGTTFSMIDIGIAGEHFCLQAEELGLGTCWIGWFDKKGAQQALKLDKRFQPVIMLAVGYPLDSNRRPGKRKDLDEICFFNQGEKPPHLPPS